MKIKNCTSAHYIYCHSLEFVLQLNATDYITISPRHLRSHDLLSSDPQLPELD